MEINRVWIPLVIGAAALAGGWIGGESWVSGVVFGGVFGAAGAGILLWLNRDRVSGREEAAPISMTTPEETILGEKLEAAHAEVEALQIRLSRLEEASRDNAWLLAEVGRIAAPLLARLETKTHEMLEQGRVDRRGEGGDLWRDLRKLSALMADLPSLGKVDAEGLAPRPEPTDLRKALPALGTSGEAWKVEVEDSVPPLLFCDRTLLTLALEPLAEAAGGSRTRPRLHLSAEPQDRGLFRLKIDLFPAPEFPSELNEHLNRGHAVAHPMPWLRGRENGVPLAIALRAVAHLGGRLSTGVEEDQTSRLRMEFVFPEAIERRQVMRQPVESAMHELETAGSLW